MSRREDEPARRIRAEPAAELAVVDALVAALRGAAVALEAAIAALDRYPAEPGSSVSTASLTALRCRIRQQSDGLAELRAELERPPAPAPIPPRRRRPRLK